MDFSYLVKNMKLWWITNPIVSQPWFSVHYASDNTSIFHWLNTENSALKIILYHLS